MKTIVAFLIIMFLLIPAAFNQEQNYGYYPSEKGVQYKEFRHKLFGFSIDIPSNWIFGIATKGGVPVVLIFPEGLNTSKITDNYETIEIGQIVNESSIEEARKYVSLGMIKGHAGYREVGNADNIEINGNAGISFVGEWQSKAGFTVYEYISLIKYENNIRTITFRTTFNINEKMDFYKGILNSYKAFARS